MKIIYEFDPEDESNDAFELKLIQNVNNLYSALIEMENYIQQVENKWISEPTVEEILDKFKDLLFKSKIFDI